MNEAKVITEEILDQAIAAAKAGHVNGLTYDQSSWCGTTCCVLGFARYLAGLEERNEGPRDEEFAESPRIGTIRNLMGCGSPAILSIMERVTPEGKIVLTRADLMRADLTRADLTRADLRDADLTRAVLRGADLRGAVLTGAVRWDGVKHVLITAEWLASQGAIL